jgi:hypothetical protein
MVAGSRQQAVGKRVRLPAPPILTSVAVGSGTGKLPDLSDQPLDPQIGGDDG